MPDSAPRLPSRPDLDQLRKQARELLRAIRAGDAAAVQRVRTVIPSSDESGDASDVTLADMQFVLAREHGFASWAKLVHHVEESRPPALAKFERLADVVARAYMAGDAGTIREVNATHGLSFVWDRDPERTRKRLTEWYASASRAPETALAEVRHLLAKQAGVDSWEELVASLRAKLVGVGEGRSRAAVDTPIYRIDEGRRSLEVRGPVSEGDWDTIIEVMREHGITALRGAGQISDSALERLSHLEQLTTLDLSFGKRLTHAGMRHLARLPLRDLELGGWGTQIDDRALDVLRHLPSLETVSLVWAERVSDAGVANLAPCMKLRSVNLMGTPTGDGALRALAGKPELAALDAGTRVTPAGLALLGGLPIFRTPLPEAVLRRARATDGEPSHLSLHPAAFVRGGLGALAGLAGLFSLRLFSVDRSIPPVTAAALEPLREMGGIESLWCDPSDDAMAVIASMPRLRKLMCQDTAASDDGWIALSRSRTIESIWGRENRALTARGLTAMSAMPALRKLGVSLRQVNDAGLASLPAFPALRDLTPIGLGDDGFRHVGRCSELESLTCMYTDDTGDAATRHVAGLRRLRRYYAGDTRITDRSLDVLAAMPVLESVELWNCPAVTDAGVAALARSTSIRRVVLDTAPKVSRNAKALFREGVDVSITG